MRVSNGWAERAAEILRREQENIFRDTYSPPRRGGCDCECHKTCHTCGRAFIGSQPHINCADTLEPSSSSWNYYGVGGYGSALTD